MPLPAIARWQLAALVFGLMFIALLAWLGVAESWTEWAGYQREYARLAAGLSGAGDPGGAQPEIRQIEIAALDRVDRCVTCHLGVTDPQMAGAPEPFTAHSSLVVSHPPQDYGCAICHGGEGRAVRTAEAHGEIPGQRGRLMPTALRQSACYACHRASTLPAADTAMVVEGIKLINEYKCLRCHQMDGVGGSVGPDLSVIASQRNWVEIYAHLLIPAALTPGSTMPDFGLRRDEATAMTAYLLTQLDERARVMDVTYLAFAPAPDGTPVASKAESLEETPATLTFDVAPEASGRDGESLFRGLDCAVCHRVGLRGGEVGPALTHIGRARDEAWLRDLLTAPSRVLPDGQMPVYELNEAQVTSLVAYLVALR